MVFARSQGLAALSRTQASKACHYGLSRCGITQVFSRSYRHAHSRNRLSAVWVPTGGITASQDEDAHSKLIRGGFLRQSHSGIFHMLPLGRRVQNKLEAVIDYYMQGLGASRVALSTITSKELWQQSGRLAQLEPELFSVQDRKGAQYMLSPTHEEEITSLVAKTVKSYKELPLRLYQITRKFRDELRPRHGLLRTREFTMKDLYTFDVSAEAALETYAKVQSAYSGVFGALKLPVMVAKASSGDMGGDISHEYHLPTPMGEDKIINCNECSYAANTEVAETRIDARHTTAAIVDASTAKVWRGISKDRSTLVNAWYPGQLPHRENLVEIGGGDVSVPAIKDVVPDLDAGINNVLSLWKEATMPVSTNEKPSTRQRKVVNIVDFRLAAVKEELLRQDDRAWSLPRSGELTSSVDCITVTTDGSGQQLNLLTARAGDGCPRCCHGTLQVQKALEVGHTFHLGRRYSEPLGATVSVPVSMKMKGDECGQHARERAAPMEMGCHGIGVSRLIGAVVEHLADEKGLQWPRAIAPYEAVVIPLPDLMTEGIKVYDELAAQRDSIDAVLDDRQVSLGWKMKDAELIGYPVVIVIGRFWKRNGGCEVQCRRLGVKETVPLASLAQRVSELLDQL